MSRDVITSPLRSMHIGLVAYGVDGPSPSLVFVRVPTERGRWLLTDRCVVEVACPSCEAAIGEPCRKFLTTQGEKRPLQHRVQTHFRRRDAWQEIKRTRDWHDLPKLRIPAEDLAAAMSMADDCEAKS